MIQKLTPAEVRGIAVADGAVLRTELHRPAAERRIRGSVLVRTPYGLAGQRGLAASLTARGFLCWLQDVHGTHGSTGVFDPYRREASDGLATVRHIRGSADHRGPLVLMGSSYGATCALEAARAAEPGPHCPAGDRVDSVVALVPTIGRHETAYALDGSPRLRDRFGWWHQHAFTRTARRPLDDALLDKLTREAEQIGPAETAHRRRAELGWAPAQLQAWRAMWDEPATPLVERFGDCRAPLLVVSGDRDFFADRAEPLRAAWGAHTRAPDSTLITGPWGHTLRDRTPDLSTRLDRWIDTRLPAGAPPAAAATDTPAEHQRREKTPAR